MTIWTTSSSNAGDFLVTVMQTLQRLEAKVDTLVAKPEPVYPTWGSR
jgi:hypothetical protein